MSDSKDKKDEIAVMEAQDGSATVDLPDGMLSDIDDADGGGAPEAKAEGGAVSDDDIDHPDDDDELRQAKRNRRRAKKDLIRKTNQEKDLRLGQLQRENEEFKRRLGQLERNTKAEQLTRIDKGIEDAQVRLEYAKMKLAEATHNQDGQAVVEAQTLWHNAQEEVKQLGQLRYQADQELKRQPNQQSQAQLPDPDVQRHATQWMMKNKWYNPAGADPDSRIAKKIDELMATQGWNPSDSDYWDELDSRLQKELPHRYNESNDGETRSVRRPRNVVGSAGREASAAYGGSNRTQFVLSPDRVKAMKEAGAWENPERKERMIKQFMNYDRQNGRRN
ncbi:hypothetical protein UFOVP239_2 [uncultured Caudovirales phage]|uniref:Uncharacterized protein n=1 Tax=uncultured Caudovirales phage TaxID=2100421 RepID=A0A6J7WPI5_9CAUD|nr:hypothetical protein UFOVP239_2 [uncultured Caudovirales phage]